MTNYGYAEYLSPKFISAKIFTIIFTLALIFIISKLKHRIYELQQNRSKHNSHRNKLLLKEKASFISHIPINTGFINLILKDMILIKRILPNKSKLIILVLWAASFFIPTEYQYFAISLIFLSLIFLNQFAYKLFNNNCAFYETLSLYKDYKILFSKFLMIFVFYNIGLTPFYLHFSVLHNIGVALNFLLLAMFIIASTKVFKNSLMIDIIYVLLFASTLTNSPIINIFNL